MILNRPVMHERARIKVRVLYCILPTGLGTMYVLRNGNAELVGSDAIFIGLVS
jgi:hypothetical protein